MSKENGTKIGNWCSKHPWKTMLLMAAFIAAFSIAYYAGLHQWKSIPDSKGVFGDSFGGLTAFFSGCAFGGLLYSLFLQRREMDETRKVLIDEKNAIEKQNRNLEYSAVITGMSTWLSNVGQMRPGELIPNDPNAQGKVDNVRITYMRELRENIDHLRKKIKANP